MNSIRQIQELNKQEVRNGISPEASWHKDYRDTAYIYIGGLPFELSEGDIITIFSQFGEPTYVNLIRDKETGTSKGFAFLKYEDQRSTDLAVDNLGGTTIMGRMLKVDHTRYKRKDDDEVVEGSDVKAAGRIEGTSNAQGSSEAVAESKRPLLREERELAKLLQNHDDDDDPMKEFLIEEKKKEISAALERKEAKPVRQDRKNNHHHRSHRSCTDDNAEHYHHSHRSKDSEERGGSRPSHRPREEQGTKDSYGSYLHREREDGRDSGHKSRNRSKERYYDDTVARTRYRDQSSRRD